LITMSDPRRLYAAAFVRAVATAMAGTLAGLHLSSIGLPVAEVGLVLSAGLLGGAIATLLASLGADAFGRRRALVGLALLASLGGAALAVGSTPWLLTAGALFGMLNAMGRDRGAALVIEQAALPSLVHDAGRTRAIAVYTVVQDAGHAAGSLLAALPALFRAGGEVAETEALRASMGVYAALSIAVVPLYCGLSRAVEAPARPRRAGVSPQSRRLLLRLSSLFALDSLGGGFLSAALLAYFFHERFGAGEAAIAVLFCAARGANAASHLAAARLARRIGLLNTMVFTHVPSSLLLVTVAFAPSFPVAAALFLLREALVEMDVPTRQSYLLAVVRPEERTFASGTTQLARTAAWAVGPAAAGLFMRDVALTTPLLAGAALKLAYDALLFVSFRHTVPPEEGPPPV
jgi:MFS family permease